MSTEKKLTAMQEAMQKIEAKSKENNSIEFQYGLNYAFRILNELLQKEKQQIIDAFEEGALDIVHSQQYYNETFKN